MKRYLPHLWNPSESISPIESGSIMTSGEMPTYSKDLDRLLVPQLGSPGLINAWEPGNLSSGSTTYSTYPMYYGVHGLRWEDNKLWWIKGDQNSSLDGRWSAGIGNVFTTGLPSGGDIVPLPDMNRAVLIGQRWGSAVASYMVVDIITGESLFYVAGHGDSYGGCFRIGTTSKVVVFDHQKTNIRVVDATDGSYQDIYVGPTIKYRSGVYYQGKCICLPWNAANWTDFNCGILTIDLG